MDRMNAAHSLDAPSHCSVVRAQDVRHQLLVVDDCELVRIGIRTVLQMSGGADVDLLEAANLHDALCTYLHKPGIDLVLLDSNLPDCRGLYGLQRFIEAFPEARVAIITGTADEFVQAQARALGAAGCVAKGQAPRAMTDAVMGLLNARDGSTRDLGSAMPMQALRPSRHDCLAELGPRHLEVLDHVLHGCSNQEISRSTGLSLGTIKNYVSTLLVALDVHSRSHLITLFR